MTDWDVWLFVAPSQGEGQNNAKDQDKKVAPPPATFFVPADQQTGAHDCQREPKNKTDDPC